jgi:hypothetical protein
MVTVDPTGQTGEQDLPGLEDLRHRGSLRMARDLRKLQMLRKDAYNPCYAPVERVLDRTRQSNDI